MTACPPGAPSPENLRVAMILDELALLAVREASRPRDMSMTAAATLSYLDSHGPARLTTLATEQGVAQPSMTQLVRRLEREGLVRRSADPHDGRAVRVAITGTGREVLAARRRRRTERLTDMVGELPADERRELAAAAEAFLPLLRRFAGSRAAPEPEPASDTASDPASDPASAPRQQSGSHPSVEPLEFI